jgi:Chromatin associated protein KTI12
MRLLIVTGLPATGKSTLAARLRQLAAADADVLTGAVAATARPVVAGFGWRLTRRALPPRPQRFARTYFPGTTTRGSTVSLLEVRSRLAARYSGRLAICLRNSFSNSPAGTAWLK